MKAEELDEVFDSGEDITPHLDLSTKSRPGQKSRRVNVDFPDWVVESLDREANRVGVTRQSIIKLWIAERLDAEAEYRTERDVPGNELPATSALA